MVMTLGQNERTWFDDIHDDLSSARVMRITHLPTVVKSVTITLISIAVAMHVAL